METGEMKKMAILRFSMGAVVWGAVFFGNGLFVPS